MGLDGWRYYNHAAIPTCAPHDVPNLEPIRTGEIWKMAGSPLLARWTSDWDCGQETSWWYLIKDESFDIAALKAKRRYEISKGKKNFEVRRIDPSFFFEQMFSVTERAFSAWPEKYRPHVDETSFGELVAAWSGLDVFGAFNRSTGLLSGYAQLRDRGDYVEFSILRTDPAEERNAINAALVSGILEYYKDRFDGQFYICDGEKSVRHETAFQDYLEKYFAFRKAYCRLNVQYRSWVSPIVKVLFPFRGLFKGKTNTGSQVSGVLKMEEISRSFCSSQEKNENLAD